MDSKRKASSAYGPSPVGTPEDRAAKRRRLQKEFNLELGETAESTTQYGLHFMDQIRNTKDKSGRLVALHFDDLPSPNDNPDYYRKIRMPISLKTVEQKLLNREFNNLTELESYVKRMVCNAKEWYPRNTLEFDDAERVRKALSNYMTQTNPAYKTIPGYTATPTPLPDTPEPENTPRPHTVSLRVASTAATPSQNVDGDEDAEGDENDSSTQAADNGDGLLLPRRRGRPPKNPQSDNNYVDVAYEGLTFFQAQDKVVEEVIRRRDDEDNFPHFAEFINLPPRSLKEYYSFIDTPMCLRKLQKLVRGIKGKNPVATGISEFNSWATFEETAALLWENAFKFNEDESEIYALAEELRDYFLAELTKAKAVVSEPSQPQKIKLRVPPPAEPSSTPSTIKLKVPGRGGSLDSPGPSTAQSAASSQGSAVNGRASVNPLDKTRSVPPAAVHSPSPARDLPLQNSEAPRPAPVGPGHAQANGVEPKPPATPKPAPTERRERLPGKGVADALFTNILIRSHPGQVVPEPLNFEILPHDRKLHQSFALHAPASCRDVQIIPSFAPFLQVEQRHYKLFVMMNGKTVPRSSITAGPNPYSQVYDARLVPGMVNIVEIHIIAGIPKSQRGPDGFDAELERVAVSISMPRS